MDGSVEGSRKFRERFREALEQALERVPVAERADAMEEMLCMLEEGGVEIWRADLSTRSPWGFSESIADQIAVRELLLAREDEPWEPEELANILKEATWEDLGNFLID